ncbi:DUF3310 domain-containing protein [Oceanobacillus oncorhynchi]|uniref:DUF3310 domain-containing protein n=1 Tax=Oceanobacillus oncorhynchi TaxID=545501 RepID=UPI0034D3C15A
MKVKVTRGHGWYEGEVGRVFNVLDTEIVSGRKVHYVESRIEAYTSYGRRFIEDDDCEVVETDKALIVGEANHSIIDAVKLSKHVSFKNDFNEAVSTTSFKNNLESNDNINHPDHYKNSKFETIELIEEVVKHYDDGFVSYCIGNALKYLSRAPFKHEEPLEDINKAAKYLEFATNHLEKGNN